jgi:hypothetical protein
MYDFGESRMKISRVQGDEANPRTPGYYVQDFAVGVPNNAREILGISKLFYRVEIPTPFKDPLTKEPYPHQPNPAELSFAIGSRFANIRVLPDYKNPEKKWVLYADGEGLDLEALQVQFAEVTSPNHLKSVSDQDWAKLQYLNKARKYGINLTAARSFVWAQGLKFFQKGSIGEVTVNRGAIIWLNNYYLEVTRPMGFRGEISTDDNGLVAAVTPVSPVIRVAAGDFDKLTLVEG